MKSKLSILVLFVLAGVLALVNPVKGESNNISNIELVELGDIDDQVLFDLRERLEKLFGISVSIITHMPDTDYAYDGNRNQYDSMAILSKMPKPDDKNLKIVGITDHDLYAPGRKFVFGENDAAKGVCVISLARLHQSYYGFPEDRALFLERALKEVAHEVGHLIGLSYSPEADNVMHPYENIEEIDCINNYYCIDKK